jgi:hypothetical protein
VNLGQLDRAVESYRIYLEKNPDAEDAADIQDLIQALGG